MAELPVGTIIGERYRIVELLGAGGFGAVYRAHHIHMSRPVALKILDVPADKPNHDEICRRFIQEAEAASRIEHPHVVTVYDVGYTSGAERQPFIAMQLFEGHDLDVEIERHGPMAPRRALRLLLQGLDALSVAHANHIIHKDLKPGNLFLSRPGTPQETLHVVDFGMASIQELDVSRITTTGQFLGTPRYVAPEYIRFQTATPAMDVYQMGLILVELLTGAPVVRSERVYSCLMAHCTGDLRLPVALLESSLGPVLEQSLALDPARRYQDAAFFAAALRAMDPKVIPDTNADSPRRSLTALQLSRSKIDHDAAAQLAAIGLMPPISAEPGSPTLDVPPQSPLPSTGPMTAPQATPAPRAGRLEIGVIEASASPVTTFDVLPEDIVQSDPGPTLPLMPRVEVPDPGPTLPLMPRVDAESLAAAPRVAPSVRRRGRPAEVSAARPEVAPVSAPARSWRSPVLVGLLVLMVASLAVVGAWWSHHRLSGQAPEAPGPPTGEANAEVPIEPDAPTEPARAELPDEVGAEAAPEEDGQPDEAARAAEIDDALPPGDKADGEQDAEPAGDEGLGEDEQRAAARGRAVTRRVNAAPRPQNEASAAPKPDSAPPTPAAEPKKPAEGERKKGLSIAN